MEVEDKSFDLTYVHCTRATPGELDKVPHTSYVFRIVRAKMFRVPGNSAVPEDTFELEVDGKVIGYGDTKEEALGIARYRLMADSREAAYAAARAVGKDQVGA